MKPGSQSGTYAFNLHFQLEVMATNYSIISFTIQSRFCQVKTSFHIPFLYKFLVLVKFPFLLHALFFFYHFPFCYLIWIFTF